jgi:hypothetical protein
MKLALVALFFAGSALAQGPSALPTAACGPENVSFNVKLGAPNSLVLPDPGKALIYFIHDSGSWGTIGYPTTKLGIDGTWVGADHSDSYFFVFVDPGEHHLCATLQSSLVDQRVELVHLNAKAGKVYFYRTRLLLSRTIELLQLEPIDSDQGWYLIASYPRSISKPKK